MVRTLLIEVPLAKNSSFRVQIKFRLTCEDLSELEDYEEEALLRIKPGDRQCTDFPHFWRHQWLDDEAIFAFRFYFAKVSETFDRKFFKAGKRYTSKCNNFNNPTAKHARHNLVSRRGASDSLADNREEPSRRRRFRCIPPVYVSTRPLFVLRRCIRCRPLQAY